MQNGNIEKFPSDFNPAPTKLNLKTYNDFVSAIKGIQRPTSPKGLVSSAENLIKDFVSALFPGVFEFITDTYARNAGEKYTDLGITYKTKIVVYFDGQLDKKVPLVNKDGSLSSSGGSTSSGCAGTIQLLARLLNAKKDGKIQNISYAVCFSADHFIFYEFNPSTSNLRGPKWYNWQIWNQKMWTQAEDISEVPPPLLCILYALEQSVLQMKAQAEIRELWQRRSPKIHSKESYGMPVRIYNESNTFHRYTIIETISAVRSLVYRAHNASGQEVCIKIKRKGDEELLNELFILQQLKGILGVPEIVDHGLAVLNDYEGTALVMNVVGVDITNYSNVTDHELQFIWEFLIQTFKRIHERGVVIADFKPQHIIITEKMPYIIDFGGAFSSTASSTLVLIAEDFASYSYVTEITQKPDDDFECLALALMYVKEKSLLPWVESDSRQLYTRMKVSQAIKSNLSCSLETICDRVKQVYKDNRTLENYPEQGS